MKKYRMQSLEHKGIYVPPYEYKSHSIKVQGNSIRLTPRTEQMAVAWVRKEMSKLSPPDRLFYKNFMEDFKEALIEENPDLPNLRNLNFRDGVDPLNDGEPRTDMEIDFSEVRLHIMEEQRKKESMTKEEKKQLARDRKTRREVLREQYGLASVDGQQMEIANWTAEPSCIFAGRGDHPKRGRWKAGPKEEDIILNLSPDAPRPRGNWKDIIWEPEKMYVAYWRDKLGQKMKYVWFSDSVFLKQNREKEKFDKAEKLASKVSKIADHIMSNLECEKEERRKIATVCWLILEVNLRVGDEKDPGEADTVGAITLRPEHVSIEGNTLLFNFLGKDAVSWVKKVEAPSCVIANITYFISSCKEYLFEGIDSKKVSRFLNEKMAGLTAKVFRTWKCSETVREFLQRENCKEGDPSYFKLYIAKMANLEAAKTANHKRKIPPSFEERLAKKEDKLRQLEAQLQEKLVQGKKIESLTQRIEKKKTDIELTKATKEYNLGTSLKSYIDPRVYVRWASRIDFNLEKLYSKALRKKFSWAWRGK